MKLLIISTQFCGLTHFTQDFKVRQLLRCYSGFLIILFTASVIINWIFYEHPSATGNSQLPDVVRIIHLLAVRIAHLVCLFEAIYRSKDLLTMNNMMEEQRKILDNMAVKKPKKQFSCTFVCNRYIWLASVYVIFTSLGFVHILLAKDGMPIMFWIIYNISFGMILLRTTQVYIFVINIHYHLEELIEILVNLNLRKEQENRKDQKSMEESLVILKKFVHLYDKIWVLSTMISRYFGISILAIFTSSFITITANGYWIYVTFIGLIDYRFKRFFYIMIIIIWTIPHVMNLMTLANACHKTIAKVRNCKSD